MWTSKNRGRYDRSGALRILGGEKAGNISRKSILGRSCCRKALWRQYEGRWSFWYERMWSLMSPHAKRISDP
jgi:hypothetical protein